VTQHGGVLLVFIGMGYLQIIVTIALWDGEDIILLFNYILWFIYYTAYVVYLNLICQ
jgi:hypothetical protein